MMIGTRFAAVFFVLLVAGPVGCAGWQEASEKVLMKAISVNKSTWNEGWPIAVRECRRLADGCLSQRKSDRTAVKSSVDLCDKARRCVAVAKAFSVASASVDQLLFKGYQAIKVSKSKEGFDKIMLEATRLAAHVAGYVVKLREFVTEGK